MSVLAVAPPALAEPYAPLIKVSAGPLAHIFYDLQSSEDVPAQPYLDLHVSKRLHLRNTDLRIGYGVNDVLDTSPPR